MEENYLHKTAYLAGYYAGRKEVINAPQKDSMQTVPEGVHNTQQQPA